MVRSMLILCAALLGTTQAHARSAADRSAIEQAARDYIEGWYTGDGERMERAVHPELAKRIVNRNERGASVLGQQGASTLVQNTRAGGGRETPESSRRTDVTVLDVYENAASVRVDAGDWVDYLHLARWNGTWKIINVLWELRPQR